MVDPHRVIGDSMWAKATAESRDFRRICGVEMDKLRLHSEALELTTSRPEGTRTATTLVKAGHKVGDRVL